MKSIVILINSLGYGGAERVVTNFLNSSVDNYNCNLILLYDDIKYDLDPKIKIIKLNENPNQSEISKFLRIPLLAYKLSSIIKKNNFKKVVSFLNRSNYINIISNFFYNHEVVISERANPSQQYSKGVSGLINKLLIKFLYPYAKFCVVNSMGNKLYIENNFSLKNVKLLYNIFDLEKISEIKLKNNPRKKFRLITVGRVDSGKNHKLIIDAIKDFDIELLIVGEGKLFNPLLNYVEKSGLNNKVFFKGQCDNVFKLLKESDCFVFSSLSEGFPNVIIEAMACGLPIISSDCKYGPREIMMPKTDYNKILKENIELSDYGILYPVNNIYLLRDAIAMVLSNNKLLSKLRENSKKRASDFDKKNHLNNYYKIFSY